MSGSQSGGVVNTRMVLEDGDFRRALDLVASLLKDTQRQINDTNRAVGDMGAQAERAAASARNFGNILGQAGFQIQDFAGQVQAGTSAMTALSQQGSQFLGVFGTGGAIAGAALTVGILASSLLGGRDAGAELNRVVEESDKLFREASASAREQTDALKNQAAAVNELSDLYASLSGAIGVFEGRRSAGKLAELAEQQADIRKRADAAVRDLLPLVQTRVDAARENALRAGRAFNVDDLSSELRDAFRAVAEFRATPDTSAATLATLANRLNEVAQAASTLEAPAERARVAIDALVPDAQKIDRQIAAQQRLQLAIENAATGVRLPTTEVTAPRVSAGRERAGIDTVLRDAQALQSAFDKVFDDAETRAEQRISRFADETSRAARSADDLAGVGREFATVFSSAFDGLISKGGSFADVLERLGLGVARILERQFITKPLEGALNSLLSGVSLSGLFGGIFGSGTPAARALGGPVDAGGAYRVGEAGPELFIPRTAGTIVPNSAMGGGPVFNIDARGAEPGVEARIRLVLAQEAPRISAYVRGDLTARVNRGGRDAATFGRR